MDLLKIAKFRPTIIIGENISMPNQTFGQLRFRKLSDENTYDNYIVLELCKKKYLLTHDIPKDHLNFGDCCIINMVGESVKLMCISSFKFNKPLNGSLTINIVYKTCNLTVICRTYPREMANEEIAKICKEISENYIATFTCNNEIYEPICDEMIGTMKVVAEVLINC